MNRQDAIAEQFDRDMDTYRDRLQKIHGRGADQRKDALAVAGDMAAHPLYGFAMLFDSSWEEGSIAERDTNAAALDSLIRAAFTEFDEGDFDNELDFRSDLSDMILEMRAILNQALRAARAAKAGTSTPSAALLDWQRLIAAM